MTDDKCERCGGRLKYVCDRCFKEHELPESSSSELGPADVAMWFVVLTFVIVLIIMNVFGGGTPLVLTIGVFSAVGIYGMWRFYTDTGKVLRKVRGWLGK
jgi:hypothetical protein